MCTFKDGASILPLSTLREREGFCEGFLTKPTSSFDDSPISDFFPAMVSRGRVFSCRRWSYGNMLQPREVHSAVNKKRCLNPFGNS